MPEAAQVGSLVTTPASHVWSYTALICAMRAVSQSFMSATVSAYVVPAGQKWLLWFGLPTRMSGHCR